MKTNPKRRILGISLIEALAALAVLAFGLLAIAKLHGDLVASTGLAKARAEAVQLAESRIEEMRNLVLRGQYDALASETDTFAGMNADFTWTSTITDEEAGVPFDPERLRIQVAVAWVDSRGADQNIIVTSELGWNSPILTAAAAAGPGAGLPPIPSPSGAARLGGGPDYSEGIPGGAEINKHPEGPDGIDDGTRTYRPVDEDGKPLGTTELIDAETGEVLLTIDDGTDFATIAGRVYIKGTSPAADTIRLLISANGYCAVTMPDPNRIPATGTVKYTYLLYQCYVGHGWHGNVGVYQMAGAGPNDEMCVGDPEVDPNLLDTTSKHPQLSIVRTYRGFENTGLLDADSNPVYLSAGIEAGQSYAGQRFLVVTITGRADDSDCLAQLRLDPTPYVAAEGGEFTGNTGKAVCLTASRASPYECPSPWPVGSPPVLASSVSISGNLANAPAEPDLDLSSVTVSASGTDCPVTGLSYVCTVSYVGLGWTGIVEVNPGVGLWASPRSYLFTEQSIDSGGNDFELTATGPGISTLTVTGTIKRPASTPLVSVNNVSIETGTCTMGDWVDDSVIYSCTTGEWLGSWSGLVTLGFGNIIQDEICWHSTAPFIDTSPAQLTIQLNDVVDNSVILNMSTKKKSGATCPAL